LDEVASHEDRGSTVKSLMIVVAIALLFLVWGLILYVVVGDKGSPGWDFGVVEDVPGESAYSTSREMRRVTPQHVMGRERESGATPGEGEP
jgi:hypothetical protein